MTPYVLVTVGKKNLLLTETNLQHNQAQEEAAICHWLGSGGRKIEQKHTESFQINT